MMLIQGVVLKEGSPAIKLFFYTTLRKCMGVRQEFITLLQNLGVDSLSACEALDTASVFTVEVTPADLN